MGAPEFFELHDGYAAYRPVAHMSLSQAIDLISGVITYAVEQKIDQLLVDSTQITGFDPPLTWERFRMSERFAQAARGTGMKVVIVALPHMVDPNRFGIMVARNRGLFANVFTADVPAIEWLLDPKAV